MMQKKFDIVLAQESDIFDVFVLSNDPIVRASSFNVALIDFDVHKVWFAKKIASDDSVFYIIRDFKKKMVGYVRFDSVLEDVFIITIHLSKHFRGKGLGKKFIGDCSKKFFLEYNADKIRAFVKKENIPSMRSFLAAGYTLLGNQVVYGSECFVLECVK
jgi:RimJ/RimL family protein N-acetyltransferase